MGEIISTLVFEIDTRHTQEELDELEQKTARLTEKLNAASESFERFFRSESHAFLMSPQETFLQDNGREVASYSNKNEPSFFAISQKTDRDQDDCPARGKTDAGVLPEVASCLNSSSAVQAEDQSRSITIIEQAFSTLLSRLERSLIRQDHSPNIPFPGRQDAAWNAFERMFPDTFSRQSDESKQMGDSRWSNASRVGDTLFHWDNEEKTRTVNSVTQAASPVIQSPESQASYAWSNSSAFPDHRDQEKTEFNAAYWGQLLDRLASFVPNGSQQETDQKQQAGSNEPVQPDDKSIDKVSAEIPFESSLGDIKKLLEKQTTEMTLQWKTTNQYLEQLTQSKNDQTFSLEVRE
ncbi:MAG: hypothetical protein PHQ75_09770 [Thermoguttaceae bacterium]|nr:hypothetical protein [Thermoguttaceae bacterium]